MTTNVNARGTRIRRLVAAASAGALVAGLLVIAATTPSAAAPPAPVILNNGLQNSGNAQWMESQAQPDDGGSSVKAFWATFLVQHAPGRTINQVVIAAPGNNSTVNVTGQTYVASAGGIETSRVTVAIGIGKPGGFGCPIVGGATRSVDSTVSMRVIDSTGESSGTVSTSVKFVEDSNCNARADFPRMTSVSQNATEVVPGQNITYSFTCDDVDSDVFSSDDDCDRANIRWRRLNDGTTSGVTLKTGMNDNAGQTHTMSFASRGYYVVEAQLGNEDGSFPNTGGSNQGWWRLGNAVVNDGATTLAGSLSLTGTEPSSIPSVNPGESVTAQATVGDSGGAAQVLEWDADGNGAFERREYTVPVNSVGNIVHPALTTAERTQSINTSTAGLKTVRARVTDNGALDAADNIRRQLTFTTQLRVNAVPQALNRSTGTNEDTPVLITMLGGDPDAQPLPELRYEIVSAMPASHGSLSSVSGNQVTFTPAPNFNGTTSFTFRASDGPSPNNGAWAPSNTATVAITVHPVNDAPTVAPKSIQTNEDTPVNVQLTGSDVEDGSNLAYSVNSPPAHGTASCSPSGLCIYTPAQDFFGADSFVVRGTDSGGLSATATVTVTVHPVNDAPIADDQQVDVPEDAANFPVTLGATDVDSINLIFTAPIDGVDHGTLSCVDSACTYSPAPDYNGSDSFTFRVEDNSGGSDTGTVTINVTPVNDAPVATDVGDAETNEDMPLPLTLGGTDVDGDPVTLAGVDDPANGTTSLDGPNQVTYTPDTHWFGVDLFDFVVTDGNGEFDTGTVTVTVHPVNDAPAVDDQAFAVDEDSTTLLSVAASDVDGDALTWSVVSGPANGQLSGGGPDVVYQPSLNFHGTDSFVVRVEDPNGLFDTATITITVLPVNDAPVAEALAVTTDEDTTVIVTLPGTDVDGDALAFEAPIDGPSNGNAFCTVATCEYTPNENFNGSDLFTYTVTDPDGASDSASVSITVVAVNDRPVAEDVALTTPEDTAVGIDVSAGDVDGDILTYSIGVAPEHGTVGGIAPNLVYDPDPNYHGPDAFTVVVDDGNGGSDTATISVDVVPVNDPPVATGGSATTPEDTGVEFQLGGTDVDGDGLAFTVVDEPNSGTLQCDSAGACTYEPEPNFSGTVTVGYEVSDGELASAGVFTITVDAVNDVPVASNSAVTTEEDTPATVTLDATDTDGDDLDYSIVTEPANGTLDCPPGGNTCVYTPADEFSGSDEFNWTASDGTSVSGTATVAITVLPVNDAPVALDVAADTDEDTPVTFTLLATDVDDTDITFTVETQPANGTVIIAGDQATYTPAVDFEGVDTFTYRATDPSGASSIAQATVTVIGAPLIVTAIETEAAIARVQLFKTQVLFPGMEAKLLGEGIGGLADKAITFSVGAQTICTAITDANGVARCGGSAPILPILLNLGYTATFTGDADHKPVSAPGPLIQILTLRL